MKFEIHGPFKLPLDGTVRSNKQVRADFVELTSTSKYKKGSKTLSDACGCYVFAVRAGKGILPWYVGKAERTPFGKECLTDRNINIYNFLLKKRAGTPLMYLVSEMTGSGDKFARPTNKSTNTSTTPIDFLESLLIRMAVKRNKKLQNTRKTKMVRELKVAGFMNTRLARSGVAGELRRVLGVK